MAERLQLRNISEFSRVKSTITNGSLALDLSSPQSSHTEGKVVFLEDYRGSRLARKIEYFDKNWRKEGLPRDWWNINNVGFSMKAQMRLLTETDDRSSWANQTERDLRGFCLEYLRQGTVFPFEYEIVNGELIDRRYGNRRMLDTVDPSERGGAVLQSLSEIQKYLLEGKDGVTTVMISPPGWTGLSMDNGERIAYEDAAIFIMQRKEDEEGAKVIGTTLRTDFDLNKVRELIRQLTGQDLPQTASVIDCVRAVAFRDGESNSSMITLEGLIDTLEAIKKSRFSYKDRTWTDMRRDVDRRQELYEFDEKTGEIINEFKEYVLSGEHSELEIQKALAATFLRLSKYFLVDKKIHYGKINTETHHARDIITTRRVMTYGQVVEEVQKLPGCAGGGNKSSTTSITDRAVSFGSETICCKCPFCGEQVEAVISNGRIWCPNKLCKKSAPYSRFGRAN